MARPLPNVNTHFQNSEMILNVSSGKSKEDSLTWNECNFVAKTKRKIPWHTERKKGEKGNDGSI